MHCNENSSVEYTCTVATTRANILKAHIAVDDQDYAS